MGKKAEEKKVSKAVLDEALTKVVAPEKSSVEKKDYENHPKFAKFKLKGSETT